MYIGFDILDLSRNKGECTMLVKNDFEGIAHFMNHPEMLPYVGGEVLFVDECTHLPNNFFCRQSRRLQELVYRANA